MRIFLAGGSGAIARQLIPLLSVAGHDVFATTRKPDRQAAIIALGGEPPPYPERQGYQKPRVSDPPYPTPG